MSKLSKEILHIANKLVKAEESQKKIFVRHIDWTSTEDSFKEGEIGRGSVILAERANIVAKDFNDMLQQLNRKYGTPLNKENWSVLDEAGRLDAQMLVDENNQEADKQDIALWKKNKKKLWSAYIVCMIEIGTTYSPTPEEMVETFKIQHN